MRRLSFLFLLFFILPTQAQNLSFVCEDGTSYLSQIAITPPIIDENLTDITVTVLAETSNFPVLNITTAENYSYCNLGSLDAAYYAASFPDSEYPFAENSAQNYITDFGVNQVKIGDLNEQNGRFLIIFETFIVENNHDYQLTLSPEILAAGGLNAYLFALTGDYQASLSISAPEQEAIVGESIEANLQTLYDLSETAVSAPIPEVEGEVTITVEANEAGFYALVLELATGEALLGDAAAELTIADDGALSLHCDSELVYDNGVRFYFPDDNAYTVTALSDTNDLVLALLHEETTGRCFDDTFGADTYSLNLPSIEVFPNPASAQVTIQAEDEAILVGGRESATGDFVLIVEGGILEEDEIDTFTIEVSPQMASAFQYLTVYALTADENLDPILSYAAEEPMTCDNAGSEETCQAEMPSLAGFGLTLADYAPLNSIDLNAMLEIVVEEAMTGSLLNFEVSAIPETSGAYIIVLHYITN